MHSRLLNLFVAAAVAAGFVAGAPRASAEFVVLNFETTTNAPPVSATLNHVATPSTVPGPYYFNRTGVPVNTNFPPPTVTFCAQLTEVITPGTRYEFDVVSLASLPTVGSQIKADYITELWGRNYETAWNIKTFASKPEEDAAYEKSVAFQLAIWELLYDGPTGTNLGLGNFIAPATPTGVPVYDNAYALATTWLGQLTGNTSYFTSRFGGSTLVGLTDPSNPKTFPPHPQDQITMIPKPVPAPPGVVLAGIGFLGLIGRSRWLRRKSAAA